MPFTPYNPTQASDSAQASSSTGFTPYNPTPLTMGGMPKSIPPDVHANFMQKLGHVAGAVGNALTSSEQTLGKGLSTAFDANTNNPNFLQSNVQKTVADVGHQSQQDQQSIIDAIHKQTDPIKRQGLVDFLKQHYGVDYHVPNAGDLNSGFNLSNKQVAGAALGVAADVASFGSYGKAASGAEFLSKGGELTKAAKGVTTAEKIAQTANEAGQVGKIIAPNATEKLATFGKGFIKGAAKNAPIGAAYGASSALQQDKGTGDILKSSVEGGIFNAVVGGLTEGRAAVKEADAPYKVQQLQESAQAQYKEALGATKEKYKELSDKVIPQLLEDKQWGTRGGLLKQALSGVELSQQKYAELGKLQGVAEIGGIQDHIASEMEKLKTPTGNILSTETTKYKALQGLQSDITDYILNDQVAKNGGPVAAQQSLRELASSYGTTLYDTRKSLQTVSDNQTLSQVQKVDAGIRDLLAKANPTYADINKVYTQNSRLVDILNETAKRESTGLSTRRLIEITASIGGGIAGTVAGTGGGLGKTAFGLGGAAFTAGVATMLESTWWNSLRAVQKNNAADKLLNMAPEQRNQAILFLARQGAKYANQIGLIK